MAGTQTTDNMERFAQRSWDSLTSSIADPNYNHDEEKEYIWRHLGVSLNKGKFDAKVVSAFGRHKDPWNTIVQPGYFEPNEKS